MNRVFSTVAGGLAHIAVLFPTFANAALLPEHLQDLPTNILPIHPDASRLLAPVDPCAETWTPRYYVTPDNSRMIFLYEDLKTRALYEPLSDDEKRQYIDYIQNEGIPYHAVQHPVLRHILYCEGSTYHPDYTPPSSFEEDYGPFDMD